MSSGIHFFPQKAQSKISFFQNLDVLHPSLSFSGNILKHHNAIKLHNRREGCVDIYRIIDTSS